MAKVLHMPNTDFNYRALKKKWKVHGIWEMLHCRVGDMCLYVLKQTYQKVVHIEVLPVWIRVM